MTEAIAKYEPLDIEELEEIERKGAEKDPEVSSSRFWKATTLEHNDTRGYDRIRVLPGVRGVKAVVRVNGHGLKPGGKFVSVACPQVASNGKYECPQCFKNRARGKGPSLSEQERDLLWEERQRPDYYVGVVDRKAQDAGPKVWRFSHSMMGKLLPLRTINGDWTNPGADGYDLIIQKRKKKDARSDRDVEYTVTADRKNSALGNMAWLEAAHDLSEFDRYYDFDDIKAIMAGNKPSGKPVTVKELLGGGTRDVTPRLPPARSVASDSGRGAPPAVADDEIPF